ncbi:uncharacterized protein [Miscanthus floridulus]|uniref:uncharacterized protein n=1 Tax=Miscanthus floridulus TaxID=154761 RepID=UPI003457E421
MASARAPVPPNIFARDLRKPSIDCTSAAEDGSPVKPVEGPEAPSTAKTSAVEPKVMEIKAEPPEADQGTDWRVPFLDYLIRGELPTDRTKARWLARQAKTYILYDRELYRQSPLGVLQ